MPPAKQPKEGRYSYRAAVAELARELKRRPRGTQARLARVLHIDNPGFTNRLKSTGLYFSIEQFGVIADELNAPIGWPWLKWEDAEAFEAFRRMVTAASRT